MDTQAALDIGREVMILSLKLSLPLLCVALLVGVIVSILQAVTQIQEMTLSFVPKIIAMVVAAMFFMPWILEQIMVFAKEMFGPMVIQ